MQLYARVRVLGIKVDPGDAKSVKQCICLRRRGFC